MRREELYLRDIIEAADHITAFLANADFPAFRESEADSQRDRPEARRHGRGRGAPLRRDESPPL